MPTIRQRTVAAITRRYPLYSGCGRLANHPVLQRIAGPSTEIAWARVPGGYWAASPLSDHVGKAIFYCGELDRKITWVCSRLVRSGDCVLDIGANLGLVTLTLSTLVGASGQVHAFEPSPQMQTLLDKAIKRNGLTNVTLHRIALGAQYGELRLSIPQGNAGAASFVPARQAPEGSDVLVPVRTLSSVMADQDIGHVRLIKIDVEGFEPEVLTGAVEFLSQRPADVLIFELNDSTDNLDRHPTIRTLSGLGYGFFGLPQRLTRMRAFRFNPQDFGSAPGSHDFIAARLGQVYDEVAERLRAV
jgi:FkbM family methyltransferase